MILKERETTNHVVFWVFNISNLLLLISSIVVWWVLRNEEIFEWVLAEIFVFAVFFSFLGACTGGYLGAVMEEDVCGKMDMGVLSSMGAFLGTTMFSLAGIAAVGLFFFVSPGILFSAFAFLVSVLFYFSGRPDIDFVRKSVVDCCGNRVDSIGKPLPQQPMKMKNKLGIMLALVAFVEVILTLLMIFVMRRDLSNQWMLGGMMYGMSGAMVGGMLGGWLSGLLDKHNGDEDCDNPIMVCGMALMGGMMAGMLAGMIGGMNALMGAATIAPTIILPAVIGFVFYYWMYRGEFYIGVSPSNQRTGEISWQKK